MKRQPERDVQPAWSWQALSPWIVPPVVIPAVMVAWFVGYVVYANI